MSYFGLLSIEIVLQDSFHSESETVNFANAVGSSRNINQWVEDKTNNKIKDLIKPDALGPDTRMVLVNAIYFKGLWEHQFFKERTTTAPFYTSETEFVNVDMMHVKVHLISNYSLYQECRRFSFRSTISVMASLRN